MATGNDRCPTDEVSYRLATELDLRDTTPGYACSFTSCELNQASACNSHSDNWQDCCACGHGIRQLHCMCDAFYSGFDCGTFDAEGAATAAAAKLQEEQDAIRTTQFVVLGVTAVLLLLMQASAAVYRPEEQQIPVVVEIITYFSMLDIVTDITYVSTEPFFFSQLKSAAVAFCAMP